MRIRDRQAEHEEPVNLLPMIDTLVFLVMFFLVATQFRQTEREVGIQLPGLSSSQAISSLPRQLVINITEDGKTVVAGKACEPQELQSLLAGMARNETQEVLIRADERSLHRYFADVAALCRDAGIGEMKIGYLATQRN